MTYKLTPNSSLLFSFVIMSKTVMLSLLAQGNTGDEILSILDVIMSDESAQNEPTADSIEF